MAPMKLIAVVGSALGVNAVLQVTDRSGSMFLATTSSPKPMHYGDSKCPCIGFDNIDGETTLEVQLKGKKLDVVYPADLGARCEAWDDSRHPQCTVGGKPGSGNGWCAQEWCYVDPCNCDLDVLPKIAALYNTEASFRGKPLFWSYASCGGKDVFTKKAPELGRPNCRCIGFAGVSGTTEISLEGGETVEYPADMGTSCQAWDLKVHPDCKGDNVPSWCKSNWCYVDPCDCDLPGDTVAKISLYLPEATFTGKNLYYSYETCGSADTFTKDLHPHACVNQETKEGCRRLSRCSWTGTRCLGSELVNHPLCKNAARQFYFPKEDSRSSSHGLSMFTTLMATAAAAAAIHV